MSENYSDLTKWRLRVELFSKYAEFNIDFTDFNANDRFFFIMNCTPYLYALAKLVFTMYKSFT